MDDVGLIGTRCRVIAGLRDVERLEGGMAGVDHAPGKMAIAAVAGAVMSGVGGETLPRIPGSRPRARHIVSGHVLVVEIDAGNGVVQRVPIIHGYCPTEIASRRLDGRLPHSGNVAPASQKAESSI